MDQQHATADPVAESATLPETGAADFDHGIDHDLAIDAVVPLDLA